MNKKSIIFVLSFCLFACLFMPSFYEILILVAAGLFLLISKPALPGISSLSSTSKSILIPSGAVTFILFCAFMINAYGRDLPHGLILTFAEGLILSAGAFVFIIWSVSAMSSGGILTGSSPEGSSTDNRIPLYTFPVLTLISFLTILLLSQSSPLYPMNIWDDPNCFMTVGRSVLGGKVMYKDIFEQKGPLLYFIHAGAALISSSSFLGVFLLEWIADLFFLFFGIKTASLFIPVRKSSFIAVTALSFMTFSVCSFHYGDSAEELVLPILAATLYIAMRELKNNRTPGVKASMISGTLFAIVFWIKYSLCGLFFGYIFFLIIFSIRRKDIRGLMRAAGGFLAGAAIISAAVLSYFVFTGSLSYLYEAYFYDNLFLYGSMSEGIPLFIKPFWALMLMFMKFDSNHVLFFLTVTGFIFLISRKDRKYGLLTLSMLFFSMLLIFWGDHQMFYYIFGLTVFTIPGWIPVIALTDKVISEEKSKAAAVCLAVLSAAILCAFSFFTAKGTFLIGGEKKDLPQYVFAEKIPEGKTLINYGFLDGGFYLTTETLPPNRFFCKLNISEILDEAAQEPLDSIREKKADYIVTMFDLYEFEGYRPIDEADMYYVNINGEYQKVNYYLYELIPDWRSGISTEGLQGSPGSSR